MKKLMLFVTSSLLLCSLLNIHNFNKNNHNDIAIKIKNDLLEQTELVNFDNGEGKYVSTVKAQINNQKNSIRFVSAIKVDINNTNISLPGTFGFHIQYEKIIEGNSTIIDKMYDVDSLYYSISTTDENGDKIIYGSELSSYYNNHEGATFKSIKEYFNDDNTEYNLFMTIEVRNIPLDNLDNYITAQPYCKLDNNTYDLAKDIKYYSFNSLKNGNYFTPKININNYKSQLINNNSYLVINTTLKGIHPNSLYLLLQLQEGWPQPTYKLDVENYIINDDFTTTLYFNLDQSVNNETILKNGDYVMSLKNNINDVENRLSNTNDDKMFKDKIASTSNKSIYEFGELYGNLKLTVTRYNESSIINNSYRLETKDNKNYLIVNSYLFIDDISKLTFKVTEFPSWTSKNQTCTYLQLNDGSYDIYLDISNYEFFAKTDKNEYGGYLLELNDETITGNNIKFSLPHENNITSGKYTFDEIWSNLKLHVVKENSIEYNSYKLENIDDKAILTINANININNINDLIFQFQKLQNGNWPIQNAETYNVEKQKDGTYNISTDISNLDICGKTSDGVNEGYLISLKTSSIDNDHISLGTAPESIKIGDKTYSFEDQWGNLKIVIS